MINKDVLEAQKGLYKQAQKQAMQAVESAKANFSAASGAIEACDSFLALLANMEEEMAKKKALEEKAEEKDTKTKV